MEQSEKFRVLDESEITATIAMLSAIDDKFGSEAVSVAIEAYHQASEEYIGSNLISLNERTINELNRKLWEKEKYGKVKYEKIEETDNALRIRVSECYYAQICQKLEEKYPRARFFGSQIFCRWNEAFTKGWSKDIGLSLDRTLMDGEAFCAFYYYNKVENKEKSD